MNQDERWMSIASPAWKFFIPTAVLAIAGFFLSVWVGAVLAVLAAYILYFFRDPGRIVPRIPGAIVSPADGKVVSVLEVPCEQMPGGRAMRVAIFLNIFNVHIQRASVAGKVVDVISKPGKCLNALNEKCSEENEQTTIWLESEDGVFGIRQISGAIARRIVCKVKVGDDLEQGQRYGLIQFGSRVELFAPLDANIRVRPGQHVAAGETCLGLINETETLRGRSRQGQKQETQPAEPAGVA